MAYQSSALKAKLTARLTRYESLLDAAYTAMEASESSEMTVGSYRLDTGEGSQSVTERDLQTIERRINWLESQIDHLRQRLAGLGVVAITMKRRV